MSVRVRFAPSPTGMLHIGSLRTVLYDHLIAKKEGGQVILRIEDTDQGRLVPGSEEEAVNSLHWVGIDFDEGPHVGGPFAPYRQSERKEAGIYQEHIQILLDNGHAYKAFDTPEELKEMRDVQEANKQNTGYFGGAWRDATPDQIDQAEAEGKPYVVRLKIPRDKTIVLNDLIRGRVEWDSNTVDDQVLIKTDGMPTYHFAAMVDDHIMGISHVLRGDEWLPSSPKHIALFEAFGWQPPVFVHCPVILGKDGKKLSKRHGATRVLDYAAQGYLPHAIKNFIALIGWSPGEDREVMTEAEMTELFSLERIQTSPGHFDLDKLKWLNANLIRSLDASTVLDHVLDLAAMPYAKEYHQGEVADEDGGETERAVRIKRWNAIELLATRAKVDRDYVLECIKLEQERVTLLADFGDACQFLLVDEPEMDSKAVEKWFGQHHARALFEAIKAHTDPSSYESLLRDFQEKTGLEKLGPVVHPTRVALTGKTTGPGLFELMAVLGPERIRARMDRALAML